ncbi:hypothetical protein [Nocardiopsis sp. LOL_012]|uniref:hypothetical protein n=1 Tax=Nocardiopsis sp. LOL_012 TaxID=3345409 RepID=UPI003A851BF7
MTGSRIGPWTDRFEELRREAALRGFVLNRGRRLVGALYTLTPPRGETLILHDLGEVERRLGLRGPTR